MTSPWEVGILLGGGCHDTTNKTPSSFTVTARSLKNEAVKQWDRQSVSLRTVSVGCYLWTLPCRTEQTIIERSRAKNNRQGTAGVLTWSAAGCVLFSLLPPLHLFPRVGPLEAMMVKGVFVALSLLLSFLGGQALEDLKPTACEYQNVQTRIRHF